MKDISQACRAVSILAVVACLLLGQRATAQSAKGPDFVGTWAGTWDGSGSGDFELTLESRDAKPGGRVAVTTDAGNYNADLKQIAFDGNKMTASYDFPLDPSAEISMTATFDGRTAKGTWLLHPKGQTTEVASGTLTVTRR
jgi:hypothetical protein